MAWARGGQFSIFFAPGAKFELGDWFTPPPVNEGGFEVVSRALDRIAFRKDMRLVNYSGSVFDLEVERTISLLGPPELAALGVTVPPGSRDNLSRRVLARAQAGIWPIERAAEISMTYLKRFMWKGTGSEAGRLKAG